MTGTPLRQQGRVVSAVALAGFALAGTRKLTPWFLLYLPGALALAAAALREARVPLLPPR